MKTLLALVIALVVTALLGGPAGATSCVMNEATPAEMLAGKGNNPGPGLEQYDVVVVGTVTAIQTNDAPGPRNGATRTTLDVHAGFGVEELPTTLAISSDDPGWMNGYAFERGATYFIPVQHPGPAGQPYYSFLCDPIAKLSGPEAAADLTAVAAENDFTVARLAPPEPPAAAASGGFPPVAVVGTAVVALVALGVVMAVTGFATGGGRRRQEPKAL